LAEGGNAADAACAMGFALQVLEPHMNGPAGEVPILYYEAAADETHVICGQGSAPARATREAFSDLGLDRIPGSGLLGATVPGACDAWCTLLERFGTQSFERVAAPAVKLARDGYPAYEFLRDTLLLLRKKFERDWPSSAALYVPVEKIGGRMRNPSWAYTLQSLIDAEKGQSGTREQKIRAARDAFYLGAVAEEIDSFLRSPAPDDAGRAHAGLLTADDLAAYRGSVETCVTTTYRGATVYKCPPWSQGPVFLQQLRLLEGFPLPEMGPGSADSLHTLIEAAKLAFADREANYGDPRAVEVPLERLLSEGYNEERRLLIDPKRASGEQRPGIGALPEGWPWVEEGTPVPAEPQAFAAAKGRGDTTHLDAVDRSGNLVSATPSGAWIMSSPVIPALGFPIGTRAQMFSLDPAHPNVVAPGKRPRTTLTPSLAVLPDGRRVAFGTPGGDQQDQWTLQFFLQLVDWDTPDLQAAIDAPTVHSMHMPSSFFPRTAQPGWMAAEARIEAAVIAELAQRGHLVAQSGAWEHGRVMAVAHHPETGLCEAASSPRSQIAYSAVLP
jgi:gamma-glutamyltranspeptidase/glutathione hydrolase